MKLFADQVLPTAGMGGNLLLVDRLNVLGVSRGTAVPLGQHTSYATAFISLLAVSIGTTLAPAPLGLGSFEAGSTAMLALLGVPVTIALAATLLLGGLILWLPLIPACGSRAAP